MTGTKHQTSVPTISGVDTNYQMSTVSLEVMYLEETQCLQMPNVFSIKKLNVSVSALAPQEDVQRWPQLNRIMVPDDIYGGELNLLIKVDVPDALHLE